MAFLALGPGAHSWLVDAAPAGAQRVRSKMTAAVALIALVGLGPVDEALGIAAAAGRFAEGDLLAIVEHRQAGRRLPRWWSLARPTPPSPAPLPEHRSAPPAR